MSIMFDVKLAKIVSDFFTEITADSDNEINQARIAEFLGVGSGSISLALTRGREGEVLKEDTRPFEVMTVLTLAVKPERLNEIREWTGANIDHLMKIALTQALMELSGGATLEGIVNTSGENSSDPMLRGAEYTYLVNYLRDLVKQSKFTPRAEGVPVHWVKEPIPKNEPEEIPPSPAEVFGSQNGPSVEPSRFQSSPTRPSFLNHSHRSFEMLSTHKQPYSWYKNLPEHYIKEYLKRIMATNPSCSLYDYVSGLLQIDKHIIMWMSDSPGLSWFHASRIPDDPHGSMVRAHFLLKLLYYVESGLQCPLFTHMNIRSSVIEPIATMVASTPLTVLDDEAHIEACFRQVREFAQGLQSEPVSEESTDNFERSTNASAESLLQFLNNLSPEESTYIRSFSQPHIITHYKLLLRVLYWLDGQDHVKPSRDLITRTVCDTDGDDSLSNFRHCLEILVQYSDTTEVGEDGDVPSHEIISAREFAQDNIMISPEYLDQRRWLVGQVLSLMDLSGVTVDDVLIAIQDDEDGAMLVMGIGGIYYRLTSHYRDDGVFDQDSYHIVDDFLLSWIEDSYSR